MSTSIAATTAPASANTDPLPFAYSTRNAFEAYAKFNSNKILHVEKQLRALSQCDIVNGTITHPVPVDSRNQGLCGDSTRVEGDYGKVIAAIIDPHATWTMLERCYWSQQSSIQSVINDGQTPANQHRDHVKTLRTRSADAGLFITNLQFYNYFINSLPAEFAFITPIPITCYVSASALSNSERVYAPPSHGGTSDDPIAPLAKNEGFQDIGWSNGGPQAGKEHGDRWFRGHRCTEKKEDNNTRKMTSSVD